MVKDRVGRQRYVAFRVEGAEGLPRGEVAAAIQEAARRAPGALRPELVRWGDGEGLVRCGHRHRDAVVDLLRTLRRVGDREVRVETLGTSGTLRKAAEKYLRGGRGPPR